MAKLRPWYQVITPREDLYLAFTGLDVSPRNPGGPINLRETPLMMKVFINPLQVWLWFGGIVVLIGSLMVIAQGLFERDALPVAAARAAEQRA